MRGHKGVTHYGESRQRQTEDRAQDRDVVYQQMQLGSIHNNNMSSQLSF